MFFRTIIGAVFQLSLFVFFSDLLRVGRWTAFRRPTGELDRPSCRQLGGSLPRTYLQDSPRGALLPGSPSPRLRSPPSWRWDALSVLT